MCMFFSLEDDILKGRVSTCSAISELTTFAFHYTLWLRGFWIWWILFAQLTISVVYCKEACKMLNICHRANIISFNSLDLFLIFPFLSGILKKFRPLGCLNFDFSLYNSAQLLDSTWVLQTLSGIWTLPPGSKVAQ